MNRPDLPLRTVRPPLPVSPATSAPGQRTPIRVLLVDDSAVVRRVLGELLDRAGLDVIGAAQDPIHARMLLQRQWPDVIVLDVEMPHMSGLEFLRELMAARPTPVVMCSTLTERGARTTMQALEAGAVGFVTKPRLGLREFQFGDSLGLVAAVRAAARTNLRALARASGHVPMAVSAGRDAAPVTLTAQAMLAPLAPPGGNAGRTAVIGLSTGGVQAIERVLQRLPAQSPAMVVVQHMPGGFTASLASRLDQLCAMRVREASDGDPVLPGQVLIAPGGHHLELAQRRGQLVVRVFDAPAVNHHRPSVDVLMRSAAKELGPQAVGVLMTGMGDDGARGLKAMRDAGAWTLAQDEASSVVWGMPREAVRLQAACEVVALDNIAERLLAACAMASAIR